MKRKRSALVVFFLMSISVFLMSACKKEKRAQWYKGAKLSATVVNDRTPPEFTVKLTWPRALYGEVLGYVVERDGEALQQVQELEYKTLASSNHVYTVYALELKGHKSERLRVEVAAPQMRAIGGKAGTIEVLEKTPAVKAPKALQEKAQIERKPSAVKLDVSVEKIKTTGSVRKETIEKVIGKTQSYWRACLRKNPQPIQTGLEIEFKKGRVIKARAPGIALQSLRVCIEEGTRKMTLKRGEGSALLSLVSK